MTGLELLPFICAALLIVWLRRREQRRRNDEHAAFLAEARLLDLVARNQARRGTPPTIDVGEIDWTDDWPVLAAEPAGVYDRERES